MFFSWKTNTRRCRQTRGAALVEYILLLSLISVLSIGMISVFGERTRSIFQETRQGLVNPTSQIVNGSNPTTGGGSSGPVITPPSAPNTTATLLGTQATVVAVATQINIPFQANTQPGDLLVAFVTHRSALTVPPGWTVRNTQNVFNNDSNQVLTVLTKIHDASDGNSITFQQASNVRLLGTVVTLRGEAEENLVVVDSRNGNTLERTGVSVNTERPNTLVLSAISEVYMYNRTSTPNHINVFPHERWAMISNQSQVGNRHGVAAAWSDSNNGTVPAPTFLVDNIPGSWAMTTVTFNGTPNGNGEVSPTDPTGGPGGTPINLFRGPPPAGTWPVFSPVVNLSHLCAPPGATWSGTGWTLPGAVFNLVPAPKHMPNYPLWVPLNFQANRTGGILPNADFDYFWYPQSMGVHIYMFLDWHYYGEEIVIPPFTIGTPTSGCVSPN